MSEIESLFHQSLVAIGFILAPLIFLSLLFYDAPYGRFARDGWGPRVSAAWGWFLMEIPAVFVIVLCFVVGNGLAPSTAWLLIGLWEIHYVHRAIVYPLRRRTAGKNVTVSVVLMGFTFQLFIGYTNGRYLGLHADEYTVQWLTDPRFLVGAALFVSGFAINFWADNELLNLRKRLGKGYHVPHSGLYRYVSCPNYLGEIVEWIGFAIAAWSVPALLMAVWTAANLVPRALANHKWYRATFPDYPETRKAVIPRLF